MNNKYLVVDSNFLISLIFGHHDALFVKILELEKNKFFDRYEGILIIISVEKEVYKTLANKFKLVLKEMLLRFPEKSLNKEDFNIWLKNEVLKSLPYYRNTLNFLKDYFFILKGLKKIEKIDLIKVDPYNLVDYLIDEIYRKNNKLVHWREFQPRLFSSKVILKRKKFVDVIDCAKKIFKEGDKDFYIFEEFVYWLNFEDNNLDFLTFDNDFYKNVISFKENCKFKKEFEVFLF